MKMYSVTPSTIEKIFTPKYKPKRHLTKNGDFLTSVIDKKTGNPVEVKIKAEQIWEDDFENYELLLLDKKAGNEIDLGGCVFTLSKEKKELYTGYMASYLNDRFAGIGIREHQIVIERMFKLKKNDVVISSIPNAFPFHYKCGFRPLKSKYEDEFTRESLRAHLDDLAKKCEVDYEDALNAAEYTEENGIIKLDSNITLGNIAEYLMRRGKKLSSNCANIQMHLDDDAKLAWRERIKKQPIFA